MTASTDDDARRMPAPAWGCVAPATCVRCSADVARQPSFAFNRFACSCAPLENGGPCVHQRLVDRYKSQFRRRRRDHPRHRERSSDAAGEPQPSTSAGYRKPNRHKSRRKIPPAPHQASSSSNDNPDVESLLQTPLSSTSTSSATPCQFNPQLTTDWTNNTNPLDSSTTTSSSSSSTSRSSSSESCSSSSTSSSSTDPASSADPASSPSIAASDSTSDSCAQTSDCPAAAQIAAQMQRRRGYQIMDEDSLQDDCDSSDEDASSSPSVGSDSDDSSSDGSTSASSDDSWWQTYERDKDILFLKKSNLMTKDSGYGSTTSPNTDSTKTDD